MIIKPITANNSGSTLLCSLPYDFTSELKAKYRLAIRKITSKNIWSIQEALAIKPLLKINGNTAQCIAQAIPTPIPYVSNFLEFDFFTGAKIDNLILTATSLHKEKGIIGSFRRCLS